MYNDVIIKIKKNHSLEIEKKGYLFKAYGNIYNKKIIDKFLSELEFKDLSYIKDNLSKISGFFFIEYYNKKTGFKFYANDLFGNFRLYKTVMKNKLYISDDFFYCKKLNEKVTKCRFEERYFSRHSYTSGGKTLIKEVEKLMPGILYFVDKNIIKSDFYMKIIHKKNNNKKLLKKRFLNFFKQNIINNLMEKRKNILFFSGGIDSTIIALIMKKNKISFIPVFVKYKQRFSDNIRDYEKTKIVSKKIGLKLKIIEVDLNEALENYKEVTFKLHPMDKPYSFVNLQINKQLIDIYGKCNIINGQSSDSIFCWGASTESIGGILQRFILSNFYNSINNNLKKIINFFVQFLYQVKWRKKGFKIYNEPISFYAGLLDPEGYLPCLFIKNPNYNKYLKNITFQICNKLNWDFEAIKMYMKMMYLQANSNIMPIKSAEYFEHNIILPFLDQRIVYLVMKYQNDLKNVLIPRYIHKEIIRDFFNCNVSDIFQNLEICIKKTEYTEFKKIMKKFNRFWSKSIERIILD